MHLSGAIYAETFLAEAAKQNLCVDKTALSFARSGKDGKCAVGQVTAADAIADQSLYDHLINSFSMRSFVPYAGYSGHDQFFDTFNRFGGLKNVQGEWLDEVATPRRVAERAVSRDHADTQLFNHVFSAIAKAPWPEGLTDDNHMAVLAKYRDQLLANGLRDDVAIDQKEFADAKAQKDAIEFCRTDPPGLPDRINGGAVGWKKCLITIHWLYQVLRGFPPAQVFAQTLLGFELASQDSDVVGINFVRAEDRRDAMAEYHTEMLMLDYLHSVYPNVHISLHAGELAPGLVPPDGLSFHIREAIDLGHAERIGHGIDVLHETDPAALLKRWPTNTSTSKSISPPTTAFSALRAATHPLHAYMAAHVPFSLSTDDEGVSRIDLTHEYVKAVVDQNLTYADLKYSARDSLEYSFLHGASLYAHPGDFTHRVAACAATISIHQRPRNHLFRFPQRQREGFAAV